MTPRLSVVVPFYNVADYIADCLESLRRQTLDSLEVILVDDGSKDDSIAVAEEFCRLDPRFRIVTQENQGLGPARNTGVKVAVGEYLTFVDSDDIVPRHAYEMMVASLDESGSSLVAGNARRFDDYGVWNSWLHRTIFAESRQATHVMDFDKLALDRMVWNKVFRRSFWDEFGYAFPAIRYEDYPVTLKAYLDAVTVDALAQPIYYWRERTSGDSITQRKNELANLRDRVASAEMVLDLLHGQTSALRHTVHRHLAQIDMVTIIDAFEHVEDADAPALAKLGKRLADRLDGAAAAASSSLGRLQHHALRSGDIDLLRILAQVRLGGALGSTRATFRGGLPWRRNELLPEGMEGQGKAVRKMLRLPNRAFYITTTVGDVVWEDSDLVVQGTAEIRNLAIDGTSKLRIVLDCNGIEVPVPVERIPAYDTHGDITLVGYSARVPRALLAGVPTKGEPAQLRAALSQGKVRRYGLLRNVGPGSPSMPPGQWISETDWLQPLPGGDNRLLLQRFVNPPRVTGAAVEGGELVIEGMLPPGAGPLHLARVWENEKIGDCLVEPGEGFDQFVARIPLTDLVNPDEPDDAVAHRTVRRLEAGDAGRPLLATGLTRTVSHVCQGRLIQVGRAADNAVVVVDGPIQPTADEVGLADGVRVVTVSGDPWGPLDFPLVWRQVGDVTGEHDVVCSLAVDTRWTAAVDVERLIARSPREGRTTPTTWQLVALPGDVRPYAVRPDAFLTSESSITILVRDHQLTLRPYADRVTIEVR
ncbi:MAG: glycosyltransferase [Hamadaea sp.]|nr:glycosyltransferase [Hamadaea sp.]